MSDARKAVFLSYASQDAEAAKRICESLRQAGVEVWFDQNELVGGDAWDAKIRGQIAACALFVPLISVNTQARREGYFRIEWRLAAQRTHAISEDTAFLLPVVLDDTRDAEARVPAEFKSVQWTRLALNVANGRPTDRSSATFCTRVTKLLGDEADNADNEKTASPSRDDNSSPAEKFPGQRKSTRRTLVTGVAAGLVLLCAVAMWRPWQKSVATSEARRLVAQARVLFEDSDTANRDNFTLAEELLKRALALEPGDGEVWAAAAQLSADVVTYSFDRTPARVELLKTQAERAIKLAPESIEAQIAYASYFRRGSRLNGASATGEEALRRFQAVVERAPSHRRALCELAQTYFALDRYEEAYAAFERANSVPGGDPQALVMKVAYLFSAQGRYADAEDAVARAIANRPLGRALTVDVLLKLCWRGDLEAAAAAVARFPAWLLLEDRGAFVAYETCMWRGEADKALTVLKGVPRDYLRDVYFTGPKAALAALAYEKAGQPLAARREWENVKSIEGRMFEADPISRDPQHLHWKALALARLGEREAADKLYRELVESSTLRSWFWSSASPAVHLAVALDRIGDVAANIDGEWRGIYGFNPRAIGPAPQAAFKYNPVFAPVRATPEFQRLMANAPAPAIKSAGPARAAEKRGEPAAPLGSDKSIAVLPFVNRSLEKENEFFTDGVHDDIVANLQKIGELTVVSNASVAPYRGTTKSPKQIGAELHVAYLLTGSVQRAGNRVRLTSELVNVRTDKAVAKTFDRDLSDIFVIQAELAKAIATVLKAALSPTEQKSLELAPTKNLAAYDLYLKGITGGGSGRSGYEHTARFMQAAVDLDPQFVEAWGWLLRCETYIYRNYDQTEERLQRVRSIYDSLRRLAPDATATILPFARYELWVRGDFERAIAETMRYISLLPNDPEGYFLLEVIQYRQGKLVEGINNIRHAIALDPKNPNYHYNLVGPLHACRRYEEEIQELQTILEMFPDDRASQRRRVFAIFRGRGSAREGDDYFASLPVDSRITDRVNWAEMTGNTADFLRLERQLEPPSGFARALRVAIARAASGDTKGARDMLAPIWDESHGAAESSKTDQNAWRRAAEIAALLGRRDDALRCLETVRGLPDTRLQPALKAADDLNCAAFVHAWLGEKNRALEAYAKLFQMPFSYLSVHEMRRNPRYAPLRNDLGFEALLKDPKNSAPLF